MLNELEQLPHSNLFNVEYDSKPVISKIVARFTPAYVGSKIPFRHVLNKDN